MNILPPRLGCYSRAAPRFAGRVGLEIGGPSDLFRRRGLFPVYSRAARIDNCCFRPQTLWSGEGAAGDAFRFHWRRRPGAQFYAEATDLRGVSSESYDFVLSSHMLEHSANPLKALREWKRVLKPGGLLLLVLPHKDGTFDHRRPVTTLDHILDDYLRGTGEDDLTHLPEILELHDFARDPEAGGIDAFAARSRSNPENRALHQHVFDTRLAVQVVSAADFQLCEVETASPLHIALLAQNAAEGTVRNESFLRAQAEHFARSPFSSDHLPLGTAD